MTNSVMSGFKVYKGTKETFISSGKASQHSNAIVFITGDTNTSESCIYAQGTYFANFTEFIDAYVKEMLFIKGIIILNEQGVATPYDVTTKGGAYLAFSAKDPSTIAVTAGNSGIEVGLTDTFVNMVKDAAPQETTYTKKEVDDMWTWEEL